MATPQDVYEQRLIEALLRVGGLKRGARGYPPDKVREAVERMIERYGPNVANLGVMGESKRMLDISTARFIDRVYNILVSQQTVPTGDAAQQVAIQLRLALHAWQQDVLRTVIISQGRITAVVRQAHLDGLAAFGKAAGIEFDLTAYDNFGANVEKNVANSRRVVHSTSVLFDNAFRNVDKAVDRWITSMEGRPSREAAFDLFQHMIGDKRIAEASQSLGQRGQLIREGVQRIGAIKERFHLPGRRLYTDMHRILISEEHSIEHEAKLYGAAQSPAIKFVSWHTSAWHDALPSSPDICDVFEQYDCHGAGAGLFRPETCPSQPHPFCQCYVEERFLPPELAGRPLGDPAPSRHPPSAAVRKILWDNRHDGSPKLTDARIAGTTKWTSGSLYLGEYRFSRFGI